MKLRLPRMRWPSSRRRTAVEVLLALWWVQNSLPSVGPSKLLSNAHSKPTNEDLRINDFDVVDHCAPIGPTISDLLQHRLKKKMLEEAQKKIPIKTNKSSTQSTTYQTKLFLPYKIRRALDKNKNQKHLSEELKNKYIHQKQPLSRFTTNKLSSLNKLVSASEGGDISIHWIDTMGNIEFCGNVSYKKNHSEFCGVGSNSNKHHGCNLKPYVSRRNSRNL